jgi:acyl carrier protein phosphodiesterase
MMRIGFPLRSARIVKPGRMPEYHAFGSRNSYHLWLYFSFTMNYLAHLYLAEEHSESLLGNLLGDFVKGAVGAGYSEEVRKGIELHRKVDRYTDSHSLVRASIQLISPHRRRFAGVMVDIFYDHLLAKNWQRYSPIPLAEFSQNIYQILRVNQPLLPARLQHMLPYIIEEDWLTSYRDLSAIDRALNRIANRIRKRFGRDNSLLNSIEELQANYQQLDSHFHTFFPDLIDYVKAQRDSGERQKMNGDIIENETLGR